MKLTAIARPMHRLRPTRDLGESCSFPVSASRTTSIGLSAANGSPVFFFEVSAICD